ncbi:MAG: DUF1328 domain-containing protein [Caldilineaceae bacterium]
MDILGWAIVALVVAVIAGALGFTGVARGAATISRTVWYFSGDCRHTLYHGANGG